MSYPPPSAPQGHGFSAPSAGPGAGDRPAPPPPDGAWLPARVEPLPGTEFALVQLQVPPGTSGLAVGSMIAGIASILVSTLVLCFGAIGSSAGWGGWVAGAFALLSVLVGAGAVVLGLVAKRQIRRSGHDGRLRFVGSGQATAGVSCGSAGAGIALLSLALSLAFQFS